MNETRVTGSLTARQWELIGYAVELRLMALEQRLRDGDHNARHLAEEYAELSRQTRRINAAIQRELAAA
ncbi:MAG: hypothetical protein KDE53_06250 [Caldilineaceae bacterium]|nr:hypothetical protein [Caldilineaceae bacterium]